MDIKQVPDVMSPEALTIFVAVPSADDPNKRVCLQDAISAITNFLLDLQTQVGELKAQIAAAQTCLDAIAKAVHGEVTAARAILAGITPPKGLN
jgi:hypothetical protein